MSIYLKFLYEHELSASNYLKMRSFCLSLACRLLVALIYQSFAATIVYAICPPLTVSTVQFLASAL